MSDSTHWEVEFKRGGEWHNALKLFLEFEEARQFLFNLDPRAEEENIYRIERIRVW